MEKDDHKGGAAMKLWIFKSLVQVSNNYHPGGGCVVVASSLRAAKALIKTVDYLDIPDDAWAEATPYLLQGKHKPRVVIFPDAGCC